MNKMTENISCLYKLLDLEGSGTWDPNGTINLNRPYSQAALRKLKFRSFSANIKNAIQNVQTPSLTCDLCANVEILNTSTVAPSGILTDTLSEKPKLLTNGDIQDQYTINILNQTGLKSYNNLYNNVIKLASYNIPLNDSMDYSISIGLQRAKIELMKILGMISSEENDTDNFDYLSFQYGDYRLPLQQTLSIYPLNGFSMMVFNDYQDKITIVPKSFNKFSQITYTPSTKQLTSVDIGQYIVLGELTSSAYNYMLVTNTINDNYSFYHLPTSIIHVNDNNTITTVTDFSENAGYQKFVSRANYGLVLSSSSGYYSQNFTFLAMSSNEVLGKPNFYCATLQRMLYNPEEFKLYDLNLNDESSKLTNYLNLIQGYRCPTTAFFVKFDCMYDNYNNYNYFIFMDDKGDKKTFYIYLFSGEATADKVISDPTLVIQKSFTFEDSTDFNIGGSDPSKWNMMIDTLNGGHGVLALNFGSVRGLVVVTQNDIQFCPFDNYLTTTQGLVTCNIYNEEHNGNTVISLSKVINNTKGDNMIISKYIKYSNIPSSVVSPSSFIDVPYATIQASLSNYQYTNQNPLQFPNYFTAGVAELTFDAANVVMFSTVADTNLNTYWYPAVLSSPASGIRYTLANSLLSVDCWNGTFTPYLPTINEFGNTSGYNWCNATHITPETPTGYQYVYYNANTDKASTYSEFIDTIFKWDQTNNTITFPNIPIYSTQNGITTYGNILFYISFSTSPEVMTFSPNIQQGQRSSCANYYSIFKQVENKTPSLYMQTYDFNKYFVILDQDYYDRINVYLAMLGTDLTLNLVSPDFPTINNYVFQLNESSLVDFKESYPPPGANKITCVLYDAAGNILTLEDAKKLYANITICIDWEFGAVQ